MKTVSFTVYGLKIHTLNSVPACSYIWASSQKNLSSGFPTKRVSNHAPQLQRLASELKFRLLQVFIWYFQKGNNKGADQTVRMHRLVCACVVPNPRKTGYLAKRPIFCCLLISFKLPDQAWQNIRSDLDPSNVTFSWYTGIG